MIRPGRMPVIPVVLAQDAKAIREELGLTQSELAAAFWMSADNGERTIRRWETTGPPLAMGLALLWLQDRHRKEKGGR